MFTYIKLASILRQIVENAQQLKQVIYSTTEIKKTQIPMAYSLLSLILNNFNTIKEAQQEITSKAQITLSNPYLLMVLMGEYISKAKIIGGGKLKKIIVENKHLLPNIDVQSKINKSIVQMRVIRRSENKSEL